MWVGVNGYIMWLGVNDVVMCVWMVLWLDHVSVNGATVAVHDSGKMCMWV